MNLKAILLITFIPALSNAELSDIQKLNGIQEQIQSNEEHQEFLAYKKSKLEEELSNTNISALKDIYESLSSQGVKFKDIRPKVTEINWANSIYGFKAMNLKPISKNGEFAVRDGYRMAFIMPAGIDELVTLEVGIANEGVGDDGKMTDDCKASIEVKLFGQSDDTELGKYGCKEVLEMKHLTTLEADFVKWLGKRLQMRQSYH